MTPSFFFTLRSLPGTEWPAVPWPEVGQIWAAYRGLDRSQWLSPDELIQGQLAQVRALVAHCKSHVPYYHKALAGVFPAKLQTLEDFRRLPLLSRRTYQQHFSEMQARSLPPGVQPTSKATSSGTSGVPIEILQTNVLGLWWLAFYLRDLEWCGFDPRGRLAGIRPTRNWMTTEDKRQFWDGLSHPNWNGQLDRLIESGPSFGLDIHRDPRHQLAWLREVAPNYLVSYPSNLDFLGRLLTESGTRLSSLRGIQTVSETLEDDVKARVEAAFGVPVKPIYSSAEAGFLASCCPEGHGMHVHSENILFEVLDKDGHPCRPGETGRVVLTALHNYRAPFIRYEIMDEATLGPERCPCGRGLPLLTRIQGKRRPLFRLADGRVKNPDWITQEFRKLGGYYQHQIIQKATGHLVVRIVPDASWTGEHPERIRRLAHEFFEGPIQVDIETMARIELPPGGKLVDVINELPLTA